MQYTTTIVTDPQFLSGAELNSALLKTLNEHKNGIEVMLQGYHSREKVRNVRFEEASLSELDRETFSITAIYAVEEFSVCSNTDTEDTEKMKLTLRLSADLSELKVEGVYIPEREPDSL